MALIVLCCRVVLSSCRAMKIFTILLCPIMLSTPNKYIFSTAHEKEGPHIRKSLDILRKSKKPLSPTTPRTSTQQGLSNLALPTFCSLKPVRMALVIQHSLVDLFLRIQNKWAILHNFLVEREAGDEDC